MAKGDLSTIGISGGARPFRVVASATRGYAGEPIELSTTYSSGASSLNTVMVAPDTIPVIGTDVFVGIAHEDMQVTSAGVVVASVLSVVVPIANTTRIRGKAKDTTNIDTDAELLAKLWDLVLFDLTSAVYTIDETAAASTSGLTIVDGVPHKGTIDVIVDARAFRTQVT